MIAMFTFLFVWKLHNQTLQSFSFVLKYYFRIFDVTWFRKHFSVPSGKFSIDTFVFFFKSQHTFLEFFFAIPFFSNFPLRAFIFEKNSENDISISLTKQLSSLLREPVLHKKQWLWVKTLKLSRNDISAVRCLIFLEFHAFASSTTLIPLNYNFFFSTQSFTYSIWINLDIPLFFFWDDNFRHALVQ